MSFQVPLRKNLLGIKPYIPGKPIEELERELGIQNASKIASNENPLGPSPKVLQALEKALSKISRYPDGGAHNLSHALSRHLGVNPKQVLLGNGSNELLVLLGQMVLNPGDEVVFAEPGFIIYPLVAQLFEAVPRAIPLKDFAHDLQAFSKALTPKTKLVYICNPNNPTGSMVSLLAVEAFLKVCPPSVLVVLDEAYYEYVELKTYFESLDILERYPNLAVLRTFSKAYGLAGLRVGYGFAHPALAAAVQKVRQPFNVNSLSLVGAEAALGDGEFVAKAVALNARMRSRLQEGLRDLGFQPAPSQANFVYFRDTQAPAHYEALLRRGVIVRPMGTGALRVTTGSEAETERFLIALREILGRSNGEP